MELAFYIMGESEEDIEKGDFLLVTSPLLGSDSAFEFYLILKQ